MSETLGRDPPSDEEQLQLHGEETDEASRDEESEVSDEEDDGQKRKFVVEYEPSRNRGPGDLLGHQAGIMRNKSSQHQTASKKRKVQQSLCQGMGAAMASNTLSIMGMGGLAGHYLHGRNHASPKGCPIGTLKQKSIDKMFGEDGAKRLEAINLEVQPKYTVGDNNPRGKNLSPPMASDKAIRAGFKSQLQGMTFQPNRAINMAVLAVNFVNAMETKLTKCKDGNPPTLDELKSACHLSLFNAWKNREEDRAAEYNPVNNDINYDHDKVHFFED